MRKVLVIVGPTAVGKTKLSIDMAKRADGEIVSADSMQVYKLMNIGTAKPTNEETEGIRHYLIDEVYPDEAFSVARFKELALKYIEEILSKGKQPIIVGGTGLYINSLIYNIDFSDTKIDWDLRERLRLEAKEKGNKYLHDRLRNIDFRTADRLHENDVKRIIRAIEVHESTQKPISFHQDMSRQNPSQYKFEITGLTMDRSRLYARINKRVDLMMEKGLLEEVKQLAAMGYGRNLTSMQGLGYKQIFSYLNGETSFDEAVELIKRDTRRYAKRQMTWFRRIEGIRWVDMEEL